MKQLLISLFVLTGLGLLAQPDITVLLDGDKAVYTINGQPLDANSPVQDYIKILGEPERVTDFKGQPRLYAWDSQGIAIDLGEAGRKTPERISINYDENDEIQKPHGKFTGQLTINGTQINSYSSPATFSGTPGVEIEKMNPVAYMGSIDALKMICMLEFDSRSNKLINISFGYKR